MPPASGPVPPGDYFLVVRAAGRALSTPARVRVTAGGTTEASLAAGAPGRVDVSVFDETGSASPAKLTFVGPIDDGDPCGPGAAVAHLTAQSSARPLPLLLPLLLPPALPSRLLPTPAPRSSWTPWR